LGKEIAACTAHDSSTLSYLALRAWTAAPDRYANRVVEYLVEDPRRLKSSEHPTGGPARAIRSASKYCSGELLHLLQETILSLRVKWEDPKLRGITQLKLLESIEQERLSRTAKRKLDELRRKFPERRELSTAEPAEAYAAGAPIAATSIAKMTDENWLQAMRKYAGIERDSSCFEPQSTDSFVILPSQSDRA